MSIYSDKLAHIQVIINCQNIDVPMCTREDGLALIAGAPSIDDVMSYNSHNNIFFKYLVFFEYWRTIILSLLMLSKSN